MKFNLSLITVCKEFSLEALDAFYTTNLFDLYGHGEIDKLVEDSPHASRMRSVQLLDIPAIIVIDQQELDVALKPVDDLASCCPGLKRVTVPGEITMPRGDVLQIFKLIPQGMTKAFADFAQPRYPFGLHIFFPILDLIRDVYVRQTRSDPLEKRLSVLNVARQLVAEQAQKMQSHVVFLAVEFLCVMEAGMELYHQDIKDGWESAEFERVPESLQDTIRLVAQARPADAPPFREMGLSNDRTVIHWLHTGLVAACMAAHCYVYGMQHV